VVAGSVVSAGERHGVENAPLVDEILPVPRTLIHRFGAKKMRFDNAEFGTL